MALIVETGAGVASANTFISLADYLLWAEERPHIPVPSDEDVMAGFLLEAAVAMAAIKQWRGTKTYAITVNSLPWPRTNVVMRDTGEILDETFIPSEIIYGQAMLAAEMYSAWADRDTPGAGASVTERTVEVGEIKESQKFGVVRNDGKLMRPSARASSMAQFSRFLNGLGIVRA